MPTKSNNTGGRGGKRPGAGRKQKSVAEKAASGNPGGRKLTVLDIPDMEGSDMPKPDEILSAPQKDGTTLKAAEIYEAVRKWLGFLSRHPTLIYSSTQSYDERDWVMKTDTQVLTIPGGKYLSGYHCG